MSESLAPDIASLTSSSVSSETVTAFETSTPETSPKKASVTSSSVSSETVTAFETSTPETSPKKATSINISISSETLTAVEHTPERSPQKSSSTLTVSDDDRVSSRLRISESTGQKTRKRKRKYYVGDLSTSDFSSPSKASKNLAMIKGCISSATSKKKVLHQRIRRLKSRVNTLDALMKVLKEKTLVGDTAESVISSSLSGPAKNVFERMLRGPSHQKYIPALRAFALTLHFYSPRAYSYVRETFNKTLPHPSTLRLWYQSVDGSPGFSKQSLDLLKLKSTEAEKKGAKVVCNLVLDEMSIRKQVEWTGKKFTGYVDVGTNIDSDSTPAAKEVVVFLLVCQNSVWKLPVGYFLIDGLSGHEKASLVRRCLMFLEETDVIVTSITFDGAPSNISMAQALGANFKDINNLKTSFPHPTTKEDIFVFLDPCHMIKLVRNSLGSCNHLIDGDSQLIAWKYFEELVNFQDSEGLHAGTKIRQRHISFIKEKMRVRLATQTLSKSVADALTFLGRTLKLHQFVGFEATAKFVYIFNNLFDILNSKTTLAKYEWKQPISAENHVRVFHYLATSANYVKLLKTSEGVPILRSARKMGYLGFLICIKSLEQLYKKYVMDTKVLKHLCTYKISQDHLELFFGAIRSRGGFNNNPTAKQFEAAYKRMLVHNEIKACNTGNVINLLAVPILSCEAVVTRTDDGEDLRFTEEFSMFQSSMLNQIDHDYCQRSASYLLTDYQEDVVAYISGFVVRSLKKCITCSHCFNILSCIDTVSELQKLKMYGNLTNASPFVIDICKVGERTFREHDKLNMVLRKAVGDPIPKLIVNTIRNLNSSILNYFGDHLFDSDPINNHSVILIKLILQNYFKIRIHYETKKKLERSIVNHVRSNLTKTIIFYNQ